MLIRGILTSMVVLLVVATLAQGSAGKIDRTAAESLDKQAAPEKPNRVHTGSVVGQVVDGSGKRVAAAKVILTDSATMETSSQTTDKHGKYKFAGLFPGVYSIQAKKHNMESDSQDLKVSNEQSATAKLVLSSKK